MLDIALIREKPEWVKDQIRKLNDPAALERIDRIVALDVKRRELVTEGENVQAARNRLNKNIGRLRGDKKMDEVTRAAFAAEATDAIKAGDYDRAAAVMEGSGDINQMLHRDQIDQAMDGLMDALRGIGERVESSNADLQII